ncbi:hypothetical protein BDV97DRAFT_348524 [Delphinella strobiligena]|nr:hypothetical protein BDV97DRAFT_348524 [Delphinella strobiligena]
MFAMAQIPITLMANTSSFAIATTIPDAKNGMCNISSGIVSGYIVAGMSILLKRQYSQEGTKAQS